MRAVFLTFSGAQGPVADAYEARWFDGNEVLAGVLRGWFGNGGGPAEVVRVDHLDDLHLELAAMPKADVVCVPGLAESGKAGDAELRLEVHRQVVVACEERNSFAVLDAPPGLTPTEARRWRTEALRADSPNAVMYYPWIRTDDGWLPPCGHVAATLAGGVELAGVVDIATDVTVNDQWALNAVGVNVLRALPGRGIWTSGALTLSAVPGLHRIAVARLVARMKLEVSRLARSRELSQSAVEMEVSSFLPGEYSVVVRGTDEYEGTRVQIDLSELGMILVLELPAMTWSMLEREPSPDGPQQDRRG